MKGKTSLFSSHLKSVSDNIPFMPKRGDFVTFYSGGIKHGKKLMSTM